MKEPFNVTWMKAAREQHLRNVALHSSGIVEVLHGSKRLFWQDQDVVVSNRQLLLCDASASFCFGNIPEEGRFLSRFFSFSLPPGEALLSFSRDNATGADDAPVIDNDRALASTLEQLAGPEQALFSPSTKAFWLMALYQQLAERGALHHVFASSGKSFRQTLSQYFARSPGTHYSLDAVAAQFAISRATLIRRLQREGTQYRDVLIEVRLGYALGQMQAGQRNVAQLAQMCGYQSQGRFSQRFKTRFGLTPTAYMATLSADAAGAV